MTMKKLTATIITIALLFSFSFIGTAEEVGVYTEFPASTFTGYASRMSVDELYETSYERAYFSVSLLLDLAVDTGISVGDSDYTIQWTSDSFIGRSLADENELYLVIPVYVKSTQSPVYLVCTYNHETGKASYSIEEWFTPYYMIYFISNVCGDENYIKNEPADMNTILEDVYQLF